MYDQTQIDPLNVISFTLKFKTKIVIFLKKTRYCIGMHSEVEESKP